MGLSRPLFDIFVSHATTQIRTMTFPHLLDRVASSQRWWGPWLISSDFVNGAGPVLDMMLLNLIEGRVIANVFRRAVCGR